MVTCDIIAPDMAANLETLKADFHYQGERANILEEFAKRFQETDRFPEEVYVPNNEGSGYKLPLEALGTQLLKTRRSRKEGFILITQSRKWEFQDLIVKDKLSDVTLPEDEDFLYRRQDHTAVVSGEERLLTIIEDRLLSYLLDRIGTIASTEDILRVLRGETEIENDNYHRVIASRLRDKINTPGTQRLINVKGHGYILRGANQDVTEVIKTAKNTLEL